MINVLELLSQRPRPSYDPEEGQEAPRRRERRLRGADGEEVAIGGLRQEFGPTGEMLELRKEIEKARTRAVAAYQKLTVSGNGSPDIRKLEKFRELVRKVRVLENQYLDLEVLAHRAHEAKREEMSRQIGEHAESAVRNRRPVSLELACESSSDRRKSQRAETKERKARIREKREKRRTQWRERIAVPLLYEAEEALAEGSLDIEEFRGFKKLLETNLDEASKDALAIGLIPADQYRYLRDVIARL